MRKLWNAIKWPLAVLCILAGITSIVIAVKNMQTNTDLAALASGLGVVLLCEPIFCILHARRISMTPPTKKAPLSAKFRHVSGLPLAEGVECLVECFSDCLSITAMNQVFTIADEKIRSASVMTRKEVEKQFVPRLFHVSRRTVRTFSRFLVVAYGDGPDEPGKFIVFQLGEWNVDKARKLAALYKGQPIAHVEL